MVSTDLSYLSLKSPNVPLISETWPAVLHQSHKMMHLVTTCIYRRENPMVSKSLEDFVAHVSGATLGRNFYLCSLQ